jgi:hypothetical protein
MQWFSSKILSSKPIQVGQRQLVIRSHAIQLALPFITSGNRLEPALCSPGSRK